MNAISKLFHRPQALAAHPAPAAGALHLAKNQLMHVPGAAGWSLRALRGSVWITRDGDLRDIVLAPGEAYLFDRDGDAIVSSLEDSELCMASNAAGQTACAEAA